MNAACRRIGLPVAALATAKLFGSTATTDTSYSQSEAYAQGSQISGQPRPKLLFVGTGSSTGCPKPLCSMLFGPNSKAVQDSPEIMRLKSEYQDKCRTSASATRGDPKINKNYRNNPALLITHVCSDNSKKSENNGECKNILIDAGKTFREGGLRWFPEHGIATLDAIILTHHHMDAVGGLDDVRGFQKVKAQGTFGKPPQMIPMPVHLSQECLDDVSDRFPWLFPNQQKEGEAAYTSGTVAGTPAVERHVASLDVQVFESFQPMDIEGLKIIPLPVWHGDDLISYGFAFSIRGTNVVYISDISKMVPETMDYILTKLPPTDILIVDSLLPEKPHSVHFSSTQAIALSQEMKAKQTYLIGMNCDAFRLHDEVNQDLQKRYGGKVLLAYDGQTIDL